MLLRFISLLVFFATFSSTQIGLVNSHEESGEWGCDSDPETQVQAEYKPGIITLDGHADDWKYVDGFEFSLLPALDPDQENAYKGGKMTVKALHDGKDVFFMLQVDGEYVYSKGKRRLSLLAAPWLFLLPGCSGRLHCAGLMQSACYGLLDEIQATYGAPLFTIGIVLDGGRLYKVICGHRTQGLFAKNSKTWTTIVDFHAQHECQGSCLYYFLKVMAIFF